MVEIALLVQKISSFILVQRNQNQLNYKDLIAANVKLCKICKHGGFHRAGLTDFCCELYQTPKWILIHEHHLILQHHKA